MAWKATFRLTGPVLVVLVLTGCLSGDSRDPRDNFELTPEHLQNREMRTRMYEGISELDILSACAGVLQDLGFTIEESESKLGVIVGSKRADVIETGEEVAWLVAAILTFGLTLERATDDYQTFRASVVVSPASTSTTDNHYVSVTFQRTVWNTADVVSKRETLEIPEIHVDFFDRLSKSVFLEGQGI